MSRTQLSEEEIRTIYFGTDTEAEPILKELDETLAQAMRETRKIQAVHTVVVRALLTTAQEAGLSPADMVQSMPLLITRLMQCLLKHDANEQLILGHIVQVCARTLSDVRDSLMILSTSKDLMQGVNELTNRTLFEHAEVKDPVQ